MVVLKTEVPQNCNYKSADYVKCCWNCDFSEENPSYSGGNLDCNKNKGICSIMGICDDFYDSSQLNSRRRKENMTREEVLNRSKFELKAMQLEALIKVTKEFLETCDDELEREVLNQLDSFQDELKEIKETYNLDF